MSPSTNLLDYWEAALLSPLGIKLKVDATERKLLQAQLYRIRKESGDDRYDDLVLTVPEGDGELWIVHRDSDERVKND